MKESKVEYWKWKNTIIDFDVISNETIDYNEYITKKDYIFHYLGTPDRQIHEWYNGGFSSEYNAALRYARQLGLVEKHIDYEDKIYELTQENKKLKEAIDKVNSILGIAYGGNEDYYIEKINKINEILKEVQENDR